MGSGIPSVKPNEFRTTEGISLKMTAKGYYYWDINISGDLNQTTITKLEQIDAIMRQRFPQNVTTLSVEQTPVIGG